MCSLERPSFNPESIEEEKPLDYTFYDYTDRMSPRVILVVPGVSREEAFAKFEETFKRKYGTGDYDGFMRQ